VKPVDPRLLRFTRATRVFFAVSVAIGVAAAALLAVQSWLAARAIADLDTGVLPALGVVVLLRAGLVAADAWISHRCGTSAKRQLRALALERLARGHEDLLTQRRSAEMAVVIGRGVDALDGFFSRYLTQLVLACAVPVVLLAYLLTQDVLSVATIVITIPVIPLFMVLIGRLTQRRSDEQFASLTQLANHFHDLLQGLKTLQAFNRASVQVEGIRTSSEQLRAATMRNLRMAFLSSFALELLTTIGVALVAVSIGFRLLRGEVAFETALIVLLLAPEVYLPLRQVGAQFHANVEGASAANAMFDIIETPLPRFGSARPRTLSSLSLDGVAFPYVLDGQPISLRVEADEHVSLVGPSGTGKSTLLHATLGFVRPASGSVLLGGVSLEELDIEHVRRRIAWLPQRVHLFDGTVEDNIRLGNPDASDADVRRVASACAVDVELSRPARQTSAGQRQRIALARTLLRDTDLVILDEPTAHLDDDTADAVRSGILQLAGDRTLVVVTHELPFTERVEVLTNEQVVT
jgi:ATP-binding cassette, subfamily C, bacterial CydCD